MDVEIFSYFWKTEEITTSGNFHSELHIYGKNMASENVCVRIESCKSRLILEFLDQDYVEKNFLELKSKFHDFIYNKNDRHSIKLVKRRKLYWCNLASEDGTLFKTFNFIEISFSSRIMMFSFKKKFLALNLPQTVKFHELNVSTESQFMAENKLSPSGWILLKNPIRVLDEEKISRCDQEWIVEKNNVKPSDNKNLINMKIMAWDIEAKCHDISKDPGNNVNDCVFQISCVFFETKTKKITKKLLTLGKCRQFEDDDVEILFFESEKDLILGFSNVIIREQPNILTGWNIFNFDITFMINRAQHNLCLGEFISFGFTNTSGEVKTLKWSSKAFSTVDIKYIDVEGIITIDLIEVVRRDYKLDSYSLNAVSKHFLKEKKDDISFQDLMRAYNSFLTNSSTLEDEFTQVGKYCVQDSKLVIDLFDKLQIWLGISEMSKTTFTTIVAVHLNGQQKKCFNQIYRYCFNNNIVVESDGYKATETDKYTGAYVFDPVPGLYEYITPLDFASLYPTIIIAYNIDYTTIVHPDNTSIPDDHLTICEWEDHIGCNHDPLIIQKKTLTRMIDSCEDKNRKKEYQKSRAVVTKKISKKIMCQKNKFRFLKQEIYGKGVLPTIIQNLLDTRKQVRQDMKLIKDKELLNVMNQRQLSYKVSANSIYGATGVKVGALPFMPIAMCVTFIGRESIQNAAAILKTLGGTIVYGDTDSNYVIFKEIQGTHEEKCKKIWEKAENVALEISSHFPNPMRIEFEEEIFYKFMILTKKRYMYYSCTKEGIVSEKIGQKGVLLSRRDNSAFVKNTYKDTVMNIFSGKSKEVVLNGIFSNVENLITKQINLELLKINKSINDYNNLTLSFDAKTQKFMFGNYIVKPPPLDLTEEEQINFCIESLPAQVQLEIKRLRRGEEKSEGSRLEFIMLEKPGIQTQGKKIEQYDFFIANRENLSVDVLFYINRLIIPIEQIFTSVYGTSDYIKHNLSVFSNKTKNVKEIKNLFRPTFKIITN